MGNDRIREHGSHRRVQGRRAQPGLRRPRRSDTAAPIGYAGGMADVTQILSAIDAGDPQAAAQLLPLVYDELRRLAAAQLAQERPGQTLDATALVHEAWLRLAPAKPQAAFGNRRHFFAAAAEAMRRIPVE